MWLQRDHEPRDVCQVSDWCLAQETLLIQVASAGGLLSFCKESQCCRHACILNTDGNNSHVMISTPHSGMIAQDPASLGEEAASLIRWELLKVTYQFQGGSPASLLPPSPSLHSLCFANVNWINSGSTCVARISSRAACPWTGHPVSAGPQPHDLPHFARGSHKQGMLLPKRHLVRGL